MTALRFISQQILLGRIRWPYLIMAVSLPLWVAIALSDVANKNLAMFTLLREHFDTADLAKPGQRVLQHALLYPILVLCYSAAVKHVFSRAGTNSKVVVQISIAAVFASMVYPMLLALLMVTYETTLPPSSSSQDLSPDFIPQIWLATTFEYFLEYCCGLFLILGVSVLVRLHHERSARLQLNNLYLRARLDTLRGQLGPHFLSNALNTVLAFVRADPDKAEQAITGLSRLLRADFDTTSAQIVSLGKELESVENYLTIMRLRFEDVLDISMNIAEEVREARIPDFLLINLLENAFKHGGSGSTGRMSVELTARREGGQVLLRISNSLPQQVLSAELGRGYGLRNTKERLAALYGKSYAMKSGPCAEGYWRVEIGLPA